MGIAVKLSLAVAVVGLAACTESPNPTDAAAPADLQPSFSQEFASPGNHVHVMPTRARYLEAFAKGGGHGGGGGGGNTGIFYHNGPILTTPRVAAIYWSNSTIFSGGPTPGATGNGSQDGSLVGYFMSNLGSSSYWRINNTYTDGSGGRVAASLGYTGFWAANTNVPSPGSSVSDAQIQAQIVAAFTSGKLAFDASTIYTVFTGPGVNLGGGFGSQYCAYHGHFSWNGNDVKFAAMPYNADFPNGCSGGNAPNGDAPADYEVNTLAHELEEAATDPDLNPGTIVAGTRTRTSARGTSGRPTPWAARPPTCWWERRTSLSSRTGSTPVRAAADWRADVAPVQSHRYI